MNVYAFAIAGAVVGLVYYAALRCITKRRARFKQAWFCNRCKEMVNDGRCDCKTSPSPWIPVDLKSEWFREYRLRRRFAKFPEGFYIVADDKGHYLTECSTTGHRYWTNDREHAARYAAYMKSTALHDLVITTGATRIEAV